MYFQIVYFTYDKHILCMLLHFSTYMVYKYFFSYSNSKKWPMLESPCKQCSSKETIIVMKNLLSFNISKSWCSLSLLSFWLIYWLCSPFVCWPWNFQQWIKKNWLYFSLFSVIYDNTNETRFEIYRSKHPVCSLVFLPECFTY